MARMIATSLGMPSLRIIEVEHPLGGLDERAIEARIAAVQAAAARILEGSDDGEEPGS